MKRFLFYLLLAAMFIQVSCKNEGEKDNNKGTVVEAENIIGKPDLKLTSDIMTPEVLWALGRLGDVQISPNGKTLLFGISYYSVDENKGNRELYTMPVDGKKMTQITKTSGGEYNAIWNKAGKIFYMCAESGSMQMWEMNADGSMKNQVSDIDGGITGFKVSPDETKILYAKEVDLVEDVVDKYPDLPKANARIIDDLMYRHWDTWTDSYSHIFIADFDGDKLTNDIDLLEGKKYDSPLKPFGGFEEINWSPDSKNLAYTCVKKVGKEYSISTNSDIYIYNLESKETVNISKGMNGYDKAPVYSPDGTKIAWESMKRDGYESDKNRLFIYDFENKKSKEYTKYFDQNVHGLTWNSNSDEIYFTSDYHARYQIYKLNLNDGLFNAVTKGDHNYRSVIVLDDKLIGTKQSMSMPTEIFAIDKETGDEKQLSFVNKDILEKLELAKVEERWITTTDNKKMLVWVIYPPHFDANKKYPTLLYCQGGPQSSVSQFFSYRWNFQMMAANGYIVVAPNRRGVPSFGQAWNEQISGDYGGQNMRDYLSAIDEVKKEPYVDETKLGAVGASYGGYSVFWLAGNHNKRFKAFIAHDGIFNFEAQYLETEEMWFVHWDLGGAFWDKTNRIAQRSYANSPHKFVQKWDTPILVIHGQKDYRIAVSQAMSAFNAAILRDVPAKFLYFPEENHWVLQPQNGILWQRTFKEWLDEHLKK